MALFIQFSREGLEFAAVEGKFCELLAFLYCQVTQTPLIKGTPCCSEIPALHFHVLRRMSWWQIRGVDEVLDCCILESGKFNVTVTFVSFFLNCVCV